MAQVTSGVRAVLSFPRIYSLFQKLMGARGGWERFVSRDVRAKAGDHVLDLGCGPGDVLDYLPAVEYWGFDISAPYIEQARRRHSGRGQFFCKLLTADDLSELPAYDIVIASGLLHHLDDDDAVQLLELAHNALKPGGRLLTIDPCLELRQNPLARFLIERDRGQNVRFQSAYVDLANRVFSNVQVVVRHKRWIPYTHCFMECTRT
jgi:SAM-dependent methyltransferase